MAIAETTLAPRISRRPLILAALLGLVVVIVALELTMGPVSLSVDDILLAITGDAPPAAQAIIAQIRAPRMVTGLCVGIGLALAGSTMQGMLRNPLADPGLIGVTGGASLGAVIVIVLGETLFSGIPDILRPYLLPLAAFIGAGIVTALVFAIARHGGQTSVATLILAGVAVNSIAGAAIGMMVYISDDRQLRDLTFWSMGSLARSDWTVVMVTLGVTLACSLAFLRLNRALDLFQLGERAAFHTGLDVERMKFRAGVLTAIVVGTITAAAGPIGFIGLIAPHMARMVMGPGHKWMMPAAALIGTVLILAADLGVRMAIPPTEPPIGLATSLIGGPFFLYLLLTRMKKGGGFA